MGEYILLRGQPFKLGTCEDLFYIRFDDLAEAIRAGDTEKENGNLEPLEYLGGGFRFRFPFPDEDQTGDYWPAYERGLMVPWPAGLLEGAEHDRPDCPAAAEPGRGDWRLEVTQQRPCDGALWVVVRCPACKMKWRLDPAEGAALGGAIEAAYPSGQRDDPGWEARSMMRFVAARIRAGYDRDLAAELAELEKEKATR